MGREAMAKTAFRSSRGVPPVTRENAAPNLGGPVCAVWSRLPHDLLQGPVRRRALELPDHPRRGGQTADRLGGRLSGDHNTATFPAQTCNDTGSPRAPICGTKRGLPSCPRSRVPDLETRCRSIASGASPQDSGEWHPNCLVEIPDTNGTGGGSSY